MIIMNRYDKNSLKAEEFINDGEILDSLKFADENKNNLELVDKIIEKARLKKGINHREASVLLACEDKERLKEIYNLARQIKKDFYGDRIVMFAPLYLSNYCVNGCVYCPYHAKNKIRAHVEATGSPRGKEILDNFSAFLPKFKKVLPYDYDRMLRVTRLIYNFSFASATFVATMVSKLRISVRRG